jgi:hypothetical protein
LGEDISFSICALECETDMKAPNEKLTETLFTVYALRYLESCGSGRVYTPSTREEYTCGYDTLLMGASEFDELYLQFKTPNLLEVNDYGFRTTPHQHERLQDYPCDTAYYVTHLFRDICAIQNAERAATDPLHFLHWYVAIEIKRLAGNLRRFRYTGDMALQEARDMRYNLETDPKRTQPKTPLSPDRWISGDELLWRFCRSEVGSRMILAGQDAADLPPAAPSQLGDRVCIMSPERANQMIRGDEGTDWGTALRKDFRPLSPTPS